MDPVLGRFTQADTIIPDPGNPLSLDRYGYVLNNPLKYIDPTGHWMSTNPTIRGASGHSMSGAGGGIWGEYSYRASDEKFIITKGIMLKGGVGSHSSYAQAAEETYTGHSSGGMESPLSAIVGLLCDVVVGLRDNTQILERSMNKGRIHASANAAIFYKYVDYPLDHATPSVSLTAVQVQNYSQEVIGIQSIYIDFYLENTSEPYKSAKVFPVGYPILTRPGFNSIQPGDIFKVSMDPVLVYPSTRAEVQIHLRSETGRYGTIQQDIIN